MAYGWGYFGKRGDCGVMRFVVKLVFRKRKRCCFRFGSVKGIKKGFCLVRVDVFFRGVRRNGRFVRLLGKGRFFVAFWK